MISSMWYSHCVSEHYLRMRSSRNTYFNVQRHFQVILSSMWYVLRIPDTARCSETSFKLDTSASQHGVGEFCKFTKGNGVNTRIALYDP